MQNRTLSLVVAVLALSGCPERTIWEVPPVGSGELQHMIPLDEERDLDILFVIDNSGSMDAEQTSLAANFPGFIEVLETIEGGLPNVHIGVVSTDVGTQNATCSANGDDGRLHAEATFGCSVSAPAGSFIVDNALDTGGRATNYPESQSLAETFACIARLGTDGCGFEQPLEAMARALDGHLLANAGFVRDDAYLAVVFITDEDDCSAFNPQLFDATQDSADAPLGYATSFRCWEYGVECEPDAPREPGVKENCVVRASSPYLHDVSRYVELLRQVKGGATERIIVAGIRGAADPVQVSVDDRGRWALSKSCGAANGDPGDPDWGAVPATRLDAFLAAFPHSTRSSICDADLSSALDTVADLLARVVGTRCLGEPLLDTQTDTANVQPNCVVSEIHEPNGPARTETIIGACDRPDDPTASTNQPCYVIAPDPEACTSTAHQLEITLYPEERELPPGATLSVRCETP